MITVKTPDGGVAQFPDGTDPNVIKQALAKKFAPDKALAPNMLAAKRAGEGTLEVSPDAARKQAAFDQAHIGDLQDTLKTGRLDALGRGALQGLTFGFGDEVVAAIRPYLHEGETYDSALKDQRDALAQARQDRPGYAYGGEIAGGVATGIATGAGFGANSPTLIGRAGGGALTGAAQGAVYGAGTGEGGAKERAINAAKSAAIGGAIGAAAPVAIAGARAGARAVANPIRSLFNMGSENQASSAIAKMLARSGMSQAEVDAALKAAASEGQPEFALADALGAPGQRALSGVARQPGEANAIVTEALTKRQGGQGDRLGSFVADALDAPDTAAQRTANLTAARGAAADTAYSAARGNAAPVDVRGALSAIDDRIGGMSGSGVAGDSIDAKLASYRGRLSANPETLKAGETARELSDFDRVLGVKQQISDDIGAAVRAGRNNEARELGKVMRELDSALEEASPSYRTANDEFAKASRTIGQIDAGKAAASPRVRASDTVPAFNALTPEQQAAFRSGYSDPVLAKIEAAAPGVNKARPLLNEKTSTELGAMANDPALLARRVGRENTMFETTNRALGGSKTADNLADIGDAKANSASAIINLLTGRWGAAAGQVADKLLAGATGSSPKSREMIAKLLLSSDINAALTPALRKKAAQVGVDNVIAALIRSGGISAAQ